MKTGANRTGPSKIKMQKLIPVAARPTTTDAEKLLCDLVLAFTRHHKDLKIQSGKVGNKWIATVQCHADDHPKLVGKDGRQIWGIKRLFQTIIARRIGKTVEINLLDPVAGKRMPTPEFKANPNWDHGQLVALLTRTLKLSLSLPFQIKIVPIANQTGIELKVNPLEIDSVRGPMMDALQNLFKAIGRHDGRDIHLELADETPDVVPALGDLEVIHTKSRPPVVDEIEQEARDRGLVA